MNEQSKNKIKSDAVNHFVCVMIGALESGFVEENTLSIAELHRIAQNHVKDNYGIDLPHITEQWGDEVARLCGYQLRDIPETEIKDNIPRNT